MTTQAKKTAGRARHPSVRGAALPNDACPRCGNMMRPRRAVQTLPINGESIAVPSSPHLRCPNCGEIVYRLNELKQLREAAFALYREKYGLLSADEIRALRDHVGLTQAALASLLRLGPNTLSRWEAGRNVQTAAMDVLLRLVRDLPGSLEYLRDHAV